ncbi:predicted protein [Entamoeba dispar SAW760]|uniref:Predicted protein n=1 Tax=Entamoeba dispar (strain ATCC PRA-260 / SAW760) TaxID=370354 RepID=B0EJ56_ENTDS|nr:uncharacterized protein EDI_027495 [Entamoeba dispar SAW760]EDR25433.1 predicted protein [Entamoeba dispar SAW760]|eukprot:EDR25433.1 predicted protein [Entamoeba dispar SAW760]
MSVIWEDPIYRFVVGPHKGNGGAVCGNDGGVWGRSETLDISFEEARACSRIFYHPTTALPFSLSGVSFEVKSISEDETINWITAKSPKYKCGCTLVETGTGYVIGYYDSPITEEENLNATLQLARHVTERGY